MTLLERYDTDILIIGAGGRRCGKGFLLFRPRQLFLPVHFYILGLALNADAEQFDGFLRWSEQPLVKFAEMGLVFLLAIHLFGGLRLLALELLPWTEKQKTFAAAATATSLFFAFAFLVSVP